MLSLVMMHGLPGSGKSYLANSLLKENGIIISTDNFWINEKTGEYKFNHDHLGDAHLWNRMNFLRCCYHHIPQIIVDNTNLTDSECMPYIKLARNYGYSWDIIEPQTFWANDLKELVKKNTHRVPIETLRNMLQRKMSVDSIIQKIKDNL